jgi:hypothetical protein
MSPTRKLPVLRHFSAAEFYQAGFRKPPHKTQPHIRAPENAYRRSGEPGILKRPRFGCIDSEMALFDIHPH